eukprot:GEMP01071497.1.p1 GENE.GEMP01071497.1~~GEMP01071497.1.p1  ORF type:complete len:138 (+),score=8.69 GEMP01071497.1:96-509(+)
MMIIFLVASITEAGRIMTLADVGSTAATSGCVTIDLSSAKTYSLSSAVTNACNSIVCPDCFAISTGSNTFTVSGCNYSPVDAAVSTTHVRIITIANFGTGTPVISDGTDTSIVTLAALGTAGSMTECLCKGGRLSCT